MRHHGGGIGLSGIPVLVPLLPHAAAVTRAAQFQLLRPKRWESPYWAGLHLLGEWR